MTKKAHSIKIFINIVKQEAAIYFVVKKCCMGLYFTILDFRGWEGVMYAIV